mmetsp:Transcript_62243/g.144824  ORF Transcript_62243/g.144824 Transcript_62243/m.144824 type:complete len:225 (+) Transcript_62243:884-1558(+)
MPKSMPLPFACASVYPTHATSGMVQTPQGLYSLTFSVPIFPEVEKSARAARTACCWPMVASIMEPVATSPAAYIRATPVYPFSSTSMSLPRETILRPLSVRASNPMSCVLPVLPVADRSMSHRKTRPSISMRISGASVEWLGPAFTLLKGVLMRISTPFACSACLMVSCRETSNIGNHAGKASMITTLLPSFAKIRAYSTLTMPAPCTTRFSGMRLICLIVSES